MDFNCSRPNFPLGTINLYQYPYFLNSCGQCPCETQTTTPVTTLPLTGYTALVSCSDNSSVYNLFLLYQNLVSISNISTFTFYLSLNGTDIDEVQSLPVQIIPTTDPTTYGTDGVFFFELVEIPDIYSSTWKVYMEVTYSDSTEAQTYSVLGSTLSTVNQPMYFVPPVAYVPGVENPEVPALTKDKIVAELSNLPYVTPPNTYSTTTPAVGIVYLIINIKQQEVTTGPWTFINQQGESILDLYLKNSDYTVGPYYDPQTKFGVSPYAEVIFTPESLIIKTNCIPNHPIGQFPISSSYSAYNYDTNPNIILPQNGTFILPRNPILSPLQNPPVLGQPPFPVREGPLGYFFDNACFFICIDEQGKDAAALEGVDAYSGHPQQQGIYHHHALNLNLMNYQVNTTVSVVGMILDGFPLVAPYLIPDFTTGEYRIITTQDLDECHGIEKTISFTFQGENLTYPYYYVCTLDFPYTVSAFRGIPGTVTGF